MWKNVTTDTKIFYVFIIFCSKKDSLQIKKDINNIFV